MAVSCVASACADRGSARVDRDVLVGDGEDGRGDRGAVDLADAVALPAAVRLLAVAEDVADARVIVVPELGSRAARLPVRLREVEVRVEVVPAGHAAVVRIYVR